MAQPFTVQWSPTTDPIGEAPSWETTLGRVATLVVDRGRGGGLFDAHQPGTMTATVRNGDHAGNAPVHELDQWRRWTPVRVRADFGTPRTVFTGYVTRLDHDLDEAPAAARATVRATDALGVWNRQVIDRETSGDTVPDDFAGFGPYTAAELADEADVDGAAGTLNSAGLARAPITLPGSTSRDGTVEKARFRDNALGAVRKALEVEIGTLHVSNAGNAALNGRYAITDAIAAGGGEGTYAGAFTLTDQAGDIDDSTVFAYRRGSLRFADPIAEYRNGAVVAGLDKKTYSATSPSKAAGEPDDVLERLDQWCTSARWLQANADLYARLFGGVRAPWPSEIAVTLWDTSMTTFPLATAVLDATDILGRTSITVVAQLPGAATPTEWLCTIEGVRFDVTAAQVVATLKLGCAAARWLAAYDLSVGVFALDVSGRGLGSGATLGP